jgi:hypothetical protein
LETAFAISTIAARRLLLLDDLIFEIPVQVCWRTNEMAQRSNPALSKPEEVSKASSLCI